MRTIARRAWLRASLTTGRIRVAHGEDPWTLPILTSLIDLCAADHDTRIDWQPCQLGWVGEMTPAVAS